MAAHYWEGNSQNTAAFVFSTPGRVEGEQVRPISGDTGANMDAIISELNVHCPDLFPELDRYYYRITNASRKVIHAAKDNGKTEDSDRNITVQQNIERVLEEISDCSVVVLCGKKAQKLSGEIKGKVVVPSCHFGNKGLRNQYPNQCEEMQGLSSKEREIKRRILCAQKIVERLTDAKTMACQTR